MIDVNITPIYGNAYSYCSRQVHSDFELPQKERWLMQILLQYIQTFDKTYDVCILCVVSLLYAVLCVVNLLYPAFLCQAFAFCILVFNMWQMFDKR